MKHDANWRNRALLSRAEVAAITGLSVLTVSRHTRAGTLKSVKVGRRRLVRPEDLIDFIKEDQPTV